MLFSMGEFVKKTKKTVTKHEGVDMEIYLEKPHSFEDHQKIAPRTWKIFHKCKRKLGVMMLGASAEGKY